MNTLHPNLEFTSERSVDGKLPFLNTEGKQVSNQLHTNVYKIATDTGQILYLYEILDTRFNKLLSKPGFPKLFTNCPL